MLTHTRVGLTCITVLSLICVIQLLPDQKAATSTKRIRLLSHAAQHSQAPGLFAYVLYATSEVYLCNALINARRLKALGVTAEAGVSIVIIVDEAWTEEEPTSNVGRRLDALRALEV